jgi:hypothetical protein
MGGRHERTDTPHLERQLASRDTTSRQYTPVRIHTGGAETVDVAVVDEDGKLIAK